MKTRASLQSLEEHWYERLRASGFTDIENRSGLLKEHHALRFCRKSRLHGREATQRYFELAEELLHTHEFQSPTHKEIWRLHSEGKTEREIFTAVEKLPPYFTSKTTIHNIISALAKLITNT